MLACAYLFLPWQQCLSAVCVYKNVVRAFLFGLVRVVLKLSCNSFVLFFKGNTHCAESSSILTYLVNVCNPVTFVPDATAHQALTAEH